MVSAFVYSSSQSAVKKGCGFAGLRECAGAGADQHSLQSCNTSKALSEAPAQVQVNMA